MSAREIAGGYTLASVLERHQGYALSQVCGMEMDQKNKLGNVHAATMELYDRESPSQAARKKAVMQALFLGPTDDSTEPSPFPSLKDYVVKRLSNSGTGNALMSERSQTALTADPPRPGEKPVPMASRSTSPGPRRSLNGAVQRLDSSRSARHSENGTGGSPKRTVRRSESGIVMTTAQRSLAEAAPPSPQADLEPAVSPQAILSRIERRYSNSGSHSLSRLSKAGIGGLVASGKLLSSGGHGALTPSGLRLITPVDALNPAVPGSTVVRSTSLSGRNGLPTRVSSTTVAVPESPGPLPPPSRLSNPSIPLYSLPPAEDAAPTASLSPIPPPRSSMSGTSAIAQPRRSISGGANAATLAAVGAVPAQASTPSTPNRPLPPPITQKPADAPQRRYVSQAIR